MKGLNGNACANDVSYVVLKAPGCVSMTETSPVQVLHAASRRVCARASRRLPPRALRTLLRARAVSRRRACGRARRLPRGLAGHGRARRRSRGSAGRSGPGRGPGHRRPPLDGRSGKRTCAATGASAARGAGGGAAHGGRTSGRAAHGRRARGRAACGGAGGFAIARAVALLQVSAGVVLLYAPGVCLAHLTHAAYRVQEAVSARCGLGWGIVTYGFGGTHRRRRCRAT